MKLVFICGCLEPGRDGVGDYTRSLARQCRNQGVECLTLSIKDGTRASESDPPEERFVNVLDNNRERTKLLHILKDFKPDWISLQYVPFSFSARGLAFKLVPLFKQVKSQQAFRLHVMFHELWTGFSPDAPWKHRLLGIPQKWILSRLLKALKPEKRHTHARGFQYLLCHSGFECAILPLFSNIPVTNDRNYGWLEDHSLQYLTLNRNRIVISLLFGTLYPDWDGEAFINQFVAHCRRIGKDPVMLSIGNLGRGSLDWEILGQKFQNQFRFHRLGFQTVNRISQIMQLCDFGISTTPASIYEKSASSAAMLDHGLPVVVTRMDSAIPGFQADVEASRIIFPDQNGKIDFTGRQKQSPEYSLPAVAARFLEHLAE